MYAGLKNPHHIKRKKEYLYSIEINDGQFIPVYREDLESKDGKHNWWYKLMVSGSEEKAGFHDKDGNEIHLNDILIVPHYDWDNVLTSWTVMVAKKSEKWSRFEKENVVLKQIHLGWDYRIRMGKPTDEREVFTAYTDECIRVG